jgi:hypothetical protein
LFLFGLVGELGSMVIKTDLNLQLICRTAKEGGERFPVIQQSVLTNDLCAAPSSFGMLYATTVAGSLETIADNTTATNVRGGHSIIKQFAQPRQVGFPGNFLECNCNAS